MADITVIVHFFGSLSLIAMLALGYQKVKRRFEDHPLAIAGLGVAFGLASMFQMYDPIEMSDGLILDMRNVPIVLAGAFLGFRGLLLCLLIAGATRLGIGGVGAVPGVVGMIIAGTVGVLWRGYTAGRERRGRDFTILAILMSSHLFAALLMPMPTAIWFLANAAPLIVGMNLVSVPILAMLLEGSEQQLNNEAGLRAMARAGSGDGFMPRDALGWALEQASVVGNMRHSVVVIAMDVRHRDLIARFWGSDVDRVVWNTLRERLNGIMPVGSVFGRLNETTILLAYAGRDPESAADFVEEIRREVTNAPVAFGLLPAFRIRADFTAKVFPKMLDLDGLSEAFATKKTTTTGHQRHAGLLVSKPNVTDVGVLSDRPSVDHDLFSVYDSLQAPSA